MSVRKKNAGAYSVGEREPTLSNAATSVPRDALLRAVLIVNAGLVLAWASAWLGMAVRGEFWRADFTNYYTAWSMVRDGRGDRLYDLTLQREYQERIVPERAEQGFLLPFISPPHLTVPAAILAVLPWESAFYVWDAGQLLLLVLLIRFLYRLTPDRRPLPFAVLLASMLAFPPLFQSFQQGQLSLLLLVCLLGIIGNLQQDRPLGVALWLTVGTIKPQLMLVPVVYLLAQRRWRELSLTACLFAVWALLATAFLGMSCWTDFATMLQHSARQFDQEGFRPLAMYNLKGFLTSVLGEGSAASVNILSVAALVVAVLVIGAMTRKPLQTGSAAWDLRLALSLQLGLLVNPHFNPSDAVTFAAPALLFYRGLRKGGQASGAAAAILIAAPALFALDCYGSTVAWPSAIHPFFVVMVGLAAAMASYLRLGAACQNVYNSELQVQTSQPLHRLVH